MATTRIFICTVLASTLCLVSSASISENTRDFPEAKNNILNGSVFIPKFMCPAIYGTFPHPEDCTKYYECRFGLAYELTCSKKKYFDEDWKVCRDKSLVKCDKGGESEETSEAPTEAPSKDFKCPWFWGTYAHPEDCSRYYICAYKIATSFRCGPLQLFDEKKKRCRLSFLVDCGSRLNRDQLTSTAEPTPSTETTEAVTTTEEPFKEGKIRFFCPFRHGKYADPNDCAQYYECRYFLKYPRRCPKSKLYDERKEECVDASRVKCGARPGGLEKDPKPEVIKCPYIWGTFPHPTDCSKYILCLYNVPTVVVCRKYELFNVFSRRCTGKRDVKCQKRINPDDEDDVTETTPIQMTTTENVTPSITMTTITTTTEEPPTTTAETIPITDPTSPATTTASTEPPTTTASTDPPTTTVETTSMTNVPPPNDCDEDDVDCIVEETGEDISKWFNCPERYGQFPHLGSKQLFIYCSNWRPSIKRCASGTVFSLTYHVCSAWDADE